MPRYFFHLRTPHGLERDDTGLDFDGLEDAYLEACEAIPSLAAEALRGRRRPTDYVFHIADASGRTLLDVPFTEMTAARERAEGAARPIRGNFLRDMREVHEIAEATKLRGLELQDHLVDARKNLSSLISLMQKIAP